LCGALALLLVTPAIAAASGPSAAGQPQTYKQAVPINVVFIGYPKQSVNVAALLGTLPSTYAPVVRYPQFYGLPGRDVGLQFDFNYKVRFAGTALEGRFFKYLAGIGKPGDPTAFQLAYNDQVNNVLDVTGPVLYIDGPSVENWLTRAGGELGIDARHSYTIYFINWYSRPDFKFHVYTKTDQSDPDTGYNFGAARDSRKMIAWGGSQSRSWFYDLSAGPEAWTNNWDVDDPDLDGNGVEDYRMPPIWEYAANGYRDPARLSSDLGLIARYVGIDLLFTTSPLYDPMVTAPGLDGDKVQNIQMLEDDPGSSGPQWIDLPYVKRELRSFEPYYDWKVRLKDEAPIDTDAQRAFRVWAGLPNDGLITYWEPYGDVFAELFGYFDANLARYVPPDRPADYVGKVFAFNTIDDNMGSQSNLLGYSDDNWVDGTQSYVFTFDTSGDRELGYGFSTTTVHEFGHHIGMSHPHDGYDAESGLDYDSLDATYFAWSGDESNTIMAYNDVSTGFGQFDRDNMYRWEFAGYANLVGSLLNHIQADPAHRKVAGLQAQAGLLKLLAVQEFRSWDYPDAAAHARLAYEVTLRAAARLGIDTNAGVARTMAVPAVVQHEVDPIRFPDN
jgi:hypothetical protein